MLFFSSNSWERDKFPFSDPKLGFYMLETKLLSFLILADLLVICLSADYKVYSTKISYRTKFSNLKLDFSLWFPIAVFISVLRSGSSWDISYFYLRSICNIKGGLFSFIVYQQMPEKKGCFFISETPCAPSLWEKFWFKSFLIKSAAKGSIMSYSSPIYGHSIFRFVIFSIISSMESAQKGLHPTIISYAITPKLHQSILRLSSDSPLIISGAM